MYYTNSRTIPKQQQQQNPILQIALIPIEMCGLLEREKKLAHRQKLRTKLENKLTRFQIDNFIFYFFYFFVLFCFRQGVRIYIKCV